jgi:hypothetical protein
MYNAELIFFQRENFLFDMSIVSLHTTKNANFEQKILLTTKNAKTQEEKLVLLFLLAWQKAKHCTPKFCKQSHDSFNVFRYRYF